MPNYKASDIASKPKHLGQYGEANISNGKVVPGVATATGDTVDICIIPAGTEVNAIILAFSSFGATAPADVGYAPVSSGDGPLAANTTYFGAAQSLAAASLGLVLAAFDPIKFEQDVYLRLTFGTVVTGAAGTVRGNALGKNKGVK